MVPGVLDRLASRSILAEILPVHNKAFYTTAIDACAIASCGCKWPEYSTRARMCSKKNMKRITVIYLNISLVNIKFFMRIMNFMLMLPTSINRIIEN